MIYFVISSLVMTIMIVFNISLGMTRYVACICMNDTDTFL